MPEKDTHQIKIKIPQEEIVFADMIIKSYEGLASLNVSRKEEGVVYLDVTEGTKNEVMNILKDLNENEFTVEIIKK
ncbi:MAG: DUF4911 domain-containing protein [Halanaerobiaceae bacterium]